MLWYRHRQVPGRQDMILVADSRGAYGSKEPEVAKMEPNAADMALAVWNGYVRDARRHARQWPPADRWRQNSKDVGLRARARRRSSLCKSSSISFVDLVLVHRCMVLLKICETQLIYIN